VVSLEERLGERTRLRLEAYQQRERDLVFNSAAEWRLLDGKPTAPDTAARLRNALDGRSRGLELLVQRRSANGLSGWIAYDLARAQRDEVPTGLRFDSDYDQRHTLTLFGSWRVGRVLNLSTRFRYGSGFPVAGFLAQKPDGVYLSDKRNGFRSGSYSRWDLRANRAFVKRRLKLTLYAEVLNILARGNHRHTGLGSVNSRTGKATLDGDDLLPFLPTAGLVLEF
jgi:hypothetical protein